MANITQFPIPTKVLDPADYPEFVGATGPQGEQGLQGIQGEQGLPGEDGADGVGIPVGGTTGQVLAKASATDYDTAWADQSSGAEAPLTLASGTITASEPALNITQTWNNAGVTFGG
jgi:hypothetical protein